MESKDARDELVKGIKLIRRIMAVNDQKEGEQKVKTSNNPSIKMVLLASKNENITGMLETIKGLRQGIYYDTISLLNLDVGKIDELLANQRSKNLSQKERTKEFDQKRLIIKAQFVLNIPAEQSIEDFFVNFKYSELQDRKIDGFEVYNEQEELILLKRETSNFQLLSKFRIPNQDFWRKEFKSLCETTEQIPHFIIEDGIEKENGENPLSPATIHELLKLEKEKKEIEQKIISLTKE